MNEKGERGIVTIYPDAFLAHCYQTDESAEVSGARLILCCVGIDRKPTRILPNDDKRLAKWLGIPMRRWLKIKRDVVGCWELSPDTRYWKLPEPDDDVAPRGGIA